jgi:hypothetical protein
MTWWSNPEVIPLAAGAACLSHHDGMAPIVQKSEPDQTCYGVFGSGRLAHAPLNVIVPTGEILGPPFAVARAAVLG